MTYGDLLQNSIDAKRTSYVYMWFEVVWENLVPIYVGKGSGNRYKIKTGRSKTFDEFVKSHSCVSMKVAKNLTEEIAYIVEEQIKKSLSEKGISIIDAEYNKEERKRRQREGLDAMKIVSGKRISAKTGNAIGRPRVEAVCELLPGETIVNACARLGISRTQWYRMTKAAA